MIPHVTLLIIFGSAAIVSLPMPFKFGSLIKKVIAAGMVAALVAMGSVPLFMPLFFQQAKIPISITATGEKNDAAEGSEIILKEISVDGNVIDLYKALPNKWIRSDKGIGWRNYDQPEGLTSTIIGQLPEGKEYSIVFEKNKWRGIVQVEINHVKKTIDCYADSGKSLNEIISHTLEDSAKMQYNTKAQKLMIAEIIFVISFFIILMLCLYFDKEDNAQLQTSDRQLWADILRILGSFVIIWLHNTCDIYSGFTKDMQVWYQYLYINSFTSFAVPCFFLLSGAFLLNRRYHIKEIFKKRFPKLAIPLLFWSILYIFVRRYRWGENISLLKTILKIPFSVQFSHLWFLYPLIGIYLLLPLLTKLYQKLTRNEKIYGILLLLFIPACIDSFFMLIKQSVSMPHFALMFPDLGLFLLGGMIMEYRNEIRGRWKWALGGCVAGYFAIVFSSYYMSLSNDSPSKDFFKMGSVPVIIFAVSIFILCLSLEDVFQQLPNKVSALIGKVSGLTMGVYLSHKLFQELVGPIKVGPVVLGTNEGSSWDMFLCSVIYFFASVALCFVLSKIPYIKRIVQ